MVDVRGRFFNNLEESGYETEAIVYEVKGRRRLEPVSVNFRRTLNTETRHTFNNFAATSSASTASLEAPRTLRTSSQNRNFFSRK